MRILSHCAAFLGFAGIQAVACGGQLSREEQLGPSAEDFFASEHIVDVQIDIDLAAWDELRMLLEARASQAPSELRVGLLQVTGLAPLPPDEVYQFWIYPTEGEPASAGFFTVDELYGGAYLRFEGFPAGARPAVRGFVITREPDGGGSEPSQDRYLGALVSPRSPE